MPVVNLPSQLVVAEDSWAASDNRIIQRSAFTAATREIVLGPASVWTCEAEIVPRDVDELLPIRAFLAAMAQPDHWCLLTMAGIGQLANLPGIPNSCQVNGAGHLGSALPVDGLTPSVLNLRAGMGLTVDLPGGKQQMFILRADLVANGSGQATAQLSAPLRASPADNATVSMSQPFAQMRLMNPLRWTNRRFRVGEIARLMFEERS